MPRPFALIRRFLVRDDAPAPVAGRAGTVPLTPTEVETLRHSKRDAIDAMRGQFVASPPPVTASPSARPVPLETRQRLVRFRGYLREHMISEPSRHDAR